MSLFAYVGDPTDAAGFRLAGGCCWTPRGNEAEAFHAALGSGADVVFIAAAVAECVPREELDVALAAGHPLVVLLPEPGLPACRLDPAERVRAQLGLDT